MAHIFKYPKESNKGIIVFTHKEWPWLLQNAQSVLNDLKQYFFLGWNQGTYFGNIQMPPIVDFAFTTPSVLDFEDNGNTLKIPLLDRNFLSSDFKNLNINNKYIDIISVSRAAKIKHLPDFMYAIRKLNDRGIYPNTLMVVPTSMDETDENANTDIVELYLKLFSPEEQKNITLMRLSKELGFMGMSPTMINWFYNNSKVLYIGSKSEGTCRVVHEGLIGGCNIVYYNNHKGGLVDYLNDTNSVSYNTHNEIDTALEVCLKNYEYSKEVVDSYDSILSERNAVNNLTPYFTELYDKNKQSFDGKLIHCDNLSLRLPSHYFDVDWKNPQSDIRAADIKSVEQLTNFINCINKAI
tara:strand:+ start:1055 stop:2113 length:1059 start_codon:yes stop_codon:yes gene_type:complete